jgi:mRNA interferase YafQ
LLIKRGYDIAKLELTIKLLLHGGLMPPEYRDHPLKGIYKGYRECHVDLIAPLSSGLRKYMF